MTTEHDTTTIFDCYCELTNLQKAYLSLSDLISDSRQNLVVDSSHILNFLNAAFDSELAKLRLSIEK